jgi:hypothetical protein
MTNYDVKHIAYHVLIAIFFIWVIVYAALLYLTLNNYYAGGNPQLSTIALSWIALNFFMGTALFIVIRQFRKQTTLSRIIFYCYFFMAAASLTTVLILIQ